MNQEDIIRMAREAEIGDSHGYIIANELAHLERFAALVAAAEREQLINLDWTALMRQGALVTWGDAEELGDRVVAAIRARGETK
jgi:hypothetical protein